MRVNRGLLFLSLSCLFAAPASRGQMSQEAIPNWPAPADWAPQVASRGVSTMGAVNSPLPFIGITPCRIADTRGNGFTGAFGPPSLVANATRSFTIVGQCGIPTSAAAVSFNFGALNVGGAGDLRVFPAGSAVPLASTLNYSASTPNIANAAVVPLGTGGAITVQADAVSIDLIIDVNGYYGSTPATVGNPFAIINDVAGGANGAGVIVGHNTNTSSANSWGGQFISDSCNAGSAGVFGVATSAPSCGGVFGVWGRSSSNFSGSAGVRGEQQGASGATYGVFGVTSSSDSNAAGVFGVDGGGSSSLPNIAFVSAGVRGESATHRGVLGRSKFGSGPGESPRYEAVYGETYRSTGVLAAAGALGWSVYGVIAFGDYGGTGAKYFIEPHPTDATKVIRYVSLEGPESGTYFRGTARTIHGEATIEVPESFRMVTDDEGLTVQLTSVGTLAILAVISQDLNQILVRSSKDVTFNYLVQGVRRAFKDHQAISEGFEFMPRSATEPMPGYLTEEAKRRLIANGTYNPDGTVNMETAERLGWTKIWAEREVGAKALP